MPNPSFPRDRFDDVPAQRGRVGAHRAENPRMRGSVVFLWAAAATVVLIAVGIVGTLAVSGRLNLFPQPTATAPVAPEVTPVVDTTYDVLVLNATPEEGLATELTQTLVGAGWSEGQISAGAAGSTDFAATTVYYATAEDEAAAAGLADVIGGAELVQNADYLQSADQKLLTVVIGLDRIAEPEPTPTE